MDSAIKKRPKIDRTRVVGLLDAFKRILRKCSNIDRTGFWTLGTLLRVFLRGVERLGGAELAERGLLEEVEEEL